MITLKKLATLLPATQMRKCALLLDQLSVMVKEERGVPPSYIQGVVDLVLHSSLDRISEQTRSLCLVCDYSWRALGDISLSLHTDLGMERADWDFFEGGEELASAVKVPFHVVLDRIRSPFNVGSIFRSSDSFGVSSISVVKPGASPLHPRSIRSSRECVDKIPWQELSEEEVLLKLEGKPLFALELGGDDINSFSFPKEGSVVIGSEELGVSPALLAAADKSLGRVSIPLFGTKRSLNVSVAFGILIYKWHSSLSLKG